MKKVFKPVMIFLAGFIFCSALAARPLLAIDMNSPNYAIQFGNIDIGSQDQSKPNSFKLTTSVGQLAAGEFSKNGYVVKAGFQYLHSVVPFGFSLSSININLGSLTPEQPALAKTNISVYPGMAGQYRVTAIEETPLKTLSGTVIPNTACDGGGDTCAAGVAKVWNSQSAYGFGYSLAGDDIPNDFKDGGNFRPFPDKSSGASPEVIMANINVNRTRQSTMTFKANIGGAQDAGTYQTIVSFVAMPGY